MKCPACKDVTLLMTEKKWVEIDYCPECRGIWLDKWELEKMNHAEKVYNQNNFEDDDDDDDHRKKHSDHWSKNDQNYWNNPNKKKKSFLDWFDFFD